MELTNLNCNQLKSLATLLPDTDSNCCIYINILIVYNIHRFNAYDLFYIFAADWKNPECIFPEWFRRIRWRDLQGTHYYHDNPMSPHTIDVDYRRHRNGRGHTITSYRCMKLISTTSKEFTVSSLSSHGWYANLVIFPNIFRQELPQKNEQ